MLVESLSGIRGIFGDDLTESVVRQYAVAFADRLLASASKSVAIGYDTRPSSSTIATWMKEEFVKSGITDIFDCAVASTAAMHLAVPTFKVAGGVMITASHNEPNWNGLKFLAPNGAMLPPAEAEALIAASRAAKPLQKQADLSGVLDVSRRLTQEYLLLLLRTVGDDARQKLAQMQLHVLVDANGGAALPYVKEFFDRFNIKVTLKGEEQGKFWRTVEPNAESLAPIVNMLEIGKEDFAVAFDCDADRMEFVLPKTSAFAKLRSPLVSGQFVLGLVVSAVLSSLEHKDKAHVVTNCATSQLVSEVVAQYGAHYEEVDIGEINVVDRMQQLQSPVGGEGSSSGGIIPPMTGRDGLMTLAVILKFLAETGKSLDEALVDLPKFVTLQAKVTIDPKKSSEVREKLIKHFEKQKNSVVVFGNDGGVKVWPNVKQFMTFRASKTEAGVYRIIVDAKTSEEAEGLLEMGKGILKKHHAKSKSPSFNG